MSAAPPIDDHFAALARAPGAVAPDEEVSATVRRYVAAARAHLESLHHGQSSGRVVNEANADLVDSLIRRLFPLAEASYFAERQDPRARRTQRLVVVAVGGFGRRELSIHSDIDLLFVYPRRLGPYIENVSERMQLWLWDAGLTVGSATRTLPETVALAEQDPTVRTALIDARHLMGDADLFHELAEAVRDELFAKPEERISELIAAMRSRHATYGESLYLLQPNVKEGAGGLRDYHTAYWAARVAHLSVRRFEDLLHAGLATETEMHELGEALDFLWRVRNSLHLRAGRKADQMSFDHQEGIAGELGLAAAAREEDALPVERFMGTYYRHARVIQGTAEMVLEQCLRPAAGPPKRRSVREVEDGFRVVDGQLQIPHAAHLRERPVRLLSCFAVAQRHDVPLSRVARRYVRENLDLVDDAFRSDPEAAACFERILDAKKRVMRSLMAMNEVRLLGAYLPEWEPIVCRWQYVLYHTYTVDVHSIFVVEELRRLWRGKYENQLPEMTHLMREVTDRPVLFLGSLLHDVGKGQGGDHSDVGTRLAQTCLERLGFSPQRRARVMFLVKHHLLMSHLAQRRDLSDPKLVLEFARTVGDRENLRSLYLLTFADIRASSAKAWSEWKGQLLGELFERTSELLETGADDPRRAFEQIEERVERRREAARAELIALGVPDGEVRSFFDMMPRRYFISHTPRQIARHALVVLAYSPDRVVTTSVRELRGGSTELIVVTRDRHGLFSQVTGVLTARGANILGSFVYSTRSGLALEIYRLTTPPGGERERRELWRGVESTLHGVLSGVVDVADLLARRRRPVGVTPSPARTPPQVSVSNAESDFYTIADVSANDRLGLLYDLTRAITDQGLEIYISKASTILDQVADTFYLKDAERKKIVDPERMESLRRALRTAVAQDPNGVVDG